MKLEKGDLENGKKVSKGKETFKGDLFKEPQVDSA
jgi:hypothetical protein